MNQMSVARLFTNGEFLDLRGKHEAGLQIPDQFHELIEYGILASQKDLFDPMEKAIRSLGEHELARTEHLHDNWNLVHTYPLSESLLALSHVWQSSTREEFVIAAKGAPEAIADLCYFDKQRFLELEKSIAGMAEEGLRVLGVARARLKQPELPKEQHDFEFEFIGLLGLSDPLRPMVPKAIKECYSAGVRVIMITGDYPGTAMNIARQIGLDRADVAITGPELDQMDDSDLARRIGGVNDSPALKAADIGIAMGGRGTDVAREASALVLLDDDFSSIVRAVRLGRRIYDNIRKAMAYIFAVHVPIVGLTFIPVLLDWPLVLMPVHIVFLELIIDPACSIVFEAEPEEADVMNRPPRDPGEAMFSRRTLALSILQGISVLVIVMAIYALSKYKGWQDGTIRANVFTTLIFANVALIMTNRSWSRTLFATLRSPNRALWWLLGSVTIVLGLVLYMPFLKELFLFEQLGLVDLAVCCMAGFISIFWFELLKYFRGRLA